MKKYLVTGLIILMPVALTLLVIVFLFDFFTTPFVDVVKDLITLIEREMGLTFPEEFAIFITRVFALIFLLIFIFILGVVARWFLIKNFLSLGNKILSKTPFVKTIYKVSRDIITALFSMDGKKVFKEPVMIPFPEKPSYAVGFEAGDIAEEIERKVGKKLVTVFTPTAPHPISGFLFLVPEEDVKKIDLTNEDAIKFLVSCGMIYPEPEKQTEEPHS